MKTTRTLTAMAMAAAIITSVAQAKWNVFPAKGAKGVCPDTRLRITFEEQPGPGEQGSLRVYKADGTLVDEIKMEKAPELKDLKGGPKWPWVNKYGGEDYNYYPVLAAGSDAEIELHSGKLEYGKEYYVLMDEGFLQSGGQVVAAIKDPNTWRFTTKEKAPAPAAEIVVSEDGTGDYATIQGAVDSVPDQNAKRITIKVGKGTFREIVSVGKGKDMVTIKGAGRDATTIEYANCDLLNPGSAKRGMVQVRAKDFILEDITLHNLTPLGGSQAETIVVKADKTIFRNCAFYSYQDTLLIQGRVFVTDCLVEGSVDFIWGAGAVYFQKCEIRSNAGGYVVQARNNKETPGYIFVDCKLTAKPGVKDIWLARTAGANYPDAQVAYINCAIGEHIRPAGWQIAKDLESTTRFQEYKNTDLAGKPLDVSKRVPASKQLTDEEAAKLKDIKNILGGKDGWDPRK